MSGYLTRPGSFAALRRVEVEGAQLGAGPIHRATQGPVLRGGAFHFCGAFPVTGPTTTAAGIRRLRASERAGITNRFAALTNRGNRMNWDRMEGNWKQVMGKVKEQWGKLTDDDLDRVAGNRDQLVGKIQNSYGIGKDEAEKQLKEWESSQSDMD